MTYPENAGHVAGSATSKAAAEALDQGERTKKNVFVESALKTLEREGATAGEMCVLMQRAGFSGVHNSSASARLCDLVAKCQAVVTLRERKDESTGKNQQVYVHVQYATAEEVAAGVRPVIKMKDAVRDELEPVHNFIRGIIQAQALSGIWGRNAPDVLLKIERAMELLK